MPKPRTKHAIRWHKVEGSRRGRSSAESHFLCAQVDSLEPRRASADACAQRIVDAPAQLRKRGDRKSHVPLPCTLRRMHGGGMHWSTRTFPLAPLHPTSGPPRQAPKRGREDEGRRGKTAFGWGAMCRLCWGTVPYRKAWPALTSAKERGSVGPSVSRATMGADGFLVRASNLCPSQAQADGCVAELRFDGGMRRLKKASVTLWRRAEISPWRRNALNMRGRFPPEGRWVGRGGGWRNGAWPHIRKQYITCSRVQEPSAAGWQADVTDKGARSLLPG